MIFGSIGKIDEPMREEIRNIVDQIDRCLCWDRHKILQQYRKLKRNFDQGKETDASFCRLQKQLNRSLSIVERRQLSVPRFGFPDLPVVDKRDEIQQAILDRQVIIVSGETGSGKTTQIPKFCLSVGRGSKGFIGHTQPRRIAARSVATRIAEELNEEVGKSVGYKVRFHDRTKPEALIKLMTDGILLAEIQSDSYLNQYDTLIIDEAHERSLNIDFLLGYLKWLLPKRSEFRVIITSATIDTERFSKHFDLAPVIEVSGRCYPVEARYREFDVDNQDNNDLARAVLAAVDELVHERLGDILVFLSGEQEIREVAKTLTKHLAMNCEVLPLYSRLNVAEQQRIFQAHKTLRIILATNVAETSLTVPGIRCVIDSGFARMSRYSSRSKLQRLPIEKISKASANQRMGRCGRLGAGVCIRLYDEEDFDSRPEFTDPEILRTNLASVILTMKALNLGDIDSFPFIDPPDSRAIRDGIEILQELNAIDSRGKLTDLGYKLSRFPLDPRLGRMIVSADTENCLTEIAIIVAGLSIQDPRERPVEFAQAADESHRAFQSDDSDFLSLLNIWNHFQEQKRHLSNNKLRKYCRKRFLSYRRLVEWQDIEHQLMQVIKGELSLKPNQLPAQYDQIHRALLSGLLGNVGLKGDGSEYQGARHQKFFIHPSSGLFKIKAKWIIAAERVETTKVYARNVAKIDPKWIIEIGAHLVKKDHYQPHWQKKAARVAVFERVSLYGLIVSSGHKIPYENIDAVVAREIFIRSALVNQEYSTNAAFFLFNQSLLESINYLHHKARRMDFVVDEELIYQFYDERIPDYVVNGRSFEKWRQRIEKSQPALLKLSADYLENSNASPFEQDQFPDEITVVNTKLRVEYQFSPGDDHDGVTAIVPLPQLNQLSAEAFEWLVPGLLKEKIMSLIKGLPKQLRRSLVPAADYAVRFLQTTSSGKGSLYQAFAAFCSKQAGTEIGADTIAKIEVDRYLNFSYSLVDAKGEVIARSTDLNALKQQYGARARDSFSEFSFQPENQQSGFHDWTFGEVPERVEAVRHDQRFVGYSAITDEGVSVGIRYLDTADEAKIQHRQGLIRLFKLLLAKDIRYLSKQFKSKPLIELGYHQLPTHPFLPPQYSIHYLDDVTTATTVTVFIDGREDIRCKALFEQRLKDGKPRLIETAELIAKNMSEILAAHSTIKKQLNKMPKDMIHEDISDQLSLLVYRGFLANVTDQKLVDINRYLNAILYRIEKALQDKQRDQSKLEELLPYWKKYWASVKSQNNVSLISPETDQFRWSLEEFRVSLFAQALKTAFPISAKRLEKAWQSRMVG